MEWEQFTGFGVAFRYPQGQQADRDDEQERIHVHSSDRQQVYVEVRRFHELAPHDEYARHKPYLEQRFGTSAVTELTQTTLSGRPAWTYSFSWDEDGRPMERKAVLAQVADDTYRVIYDPRSELNERVIATIALAEPD